MCCAPLFGSIPTIFPRRAFRSPITSPMNSSGVTTSIDMIGSSSTGPRSGAPPPTPRTLTRAGNAEGPLVRVHVVEAPVDGLHRHVHHRVARHRPAAHRLLG